MKKIVKLTSPPIERMIEHMRNGMFEVVLPVNHEILKVAWENNIELAIWVIVSLDELNLYEEEIKNEVTTYQRVRFCVLKTKEYFPFEIEAPASRLYIGTVHTTVTEYHIFKVLSV